MPAWVPGTPRLWNLTSGAAEAVSAALLLPPRTRRAGGAIAFATSVAMYPANVHAAVTCGTPGLRGFAGSATAAWLRLPLPAPPRWGAAGIARAAETG